LRIATESKNGNWIDMGYDWFRSGT
jgi:hypothetical protein